MHMRGVVCVGLHTRTASHREAPAFSHGTCFTFAKDLGRLIVHRSRSVETRRWFGDPVETKTDSLACVVRSSVSEAAIGDSKDAVYVSADSRTVQANIRIGRTPLRLGSDSRALKTGKSKTRANQDLSVNMTLVLLQDLG